MITDSVLVNVTKEGISPIPPVPPKPGKNNTPWIILGAVLGGVLVIGIIGYVIYYIRKKRSEVGF